MSLARTSAHFADNFHERAGVHFELEGELSQALLNRCHIDFFLTAGRYFIGRFEIVAVVGYFAVDGSEITEEIFKYFELEAVFTQDKA